MELGEFLSATWARCLKAGPEVRAGHTACMLPHGHDGPHRFLLGELWLRVGNVPPEQFEEMLETAAYFFGITEEPGE